jgi:hypothetical protein
LDRPHSQLHLATRGPQCVRRHDVAAAWSRRQAAPPLVISGGGKSAWSDLRLANPHNPCFCELFHGDFLKKPAKSKAYFLQIRVKMQSLMQSKNFIICLIIMVIYAVGAIFSPKFHYGFFGVVILFVAGTLFTTIGVIIGEKFRDFTMPDTISASGAGDMFTKKLFWKMGPQAIGWFIGLMAVNGLLKTIFGY